MHTNLSFFPPNPPTRARTHTHSRKESGSECLHRLIVNMYILSTTVINVSGSATAPVRQGEVGRAAVPTLLSSDKLIRPPRRLPLMHLAVDQRGRVNCSVSHCANAPHWRPWLGQDPGLALLRPLKHIYIPVCRHEKTPLTTAEEWLAGEMARQSEEQEAERKECQRHAGRQGVGSSKGFEWSGKEVGNEDGGRREKRQRRGGATSKGGSRMGK